MTETKIPLIEVLTAIQPIEDNGGLDSPMLHNKLQEYSPFEGDMWQDFLNSPAGGLKEEKAARVLGSYYFLKTADKLQHYTDNKEQWTQRFNTSSEELYGKPDRKIALGIIAIDNTELSHTPTPTLASRIYGELSKTVSGSSIHETKKDSILELRTALFDFLPDIVLTIEALKDKEYTPAEVREIFKTIISSLAEKDTTWLEWKITNQPLKTMMSVTSESKFIDVPDGRSNIKNKNELLGLAFHEIGVHAMRGNNGVKSTGLLAQGLPEYNDFEEGLGVIFEYITTGNIPQKIKDRYVDIALATGVIDDHIMSRSELIDLALSREKTRAMIKGTPLRDRGTLIKDVTSHINRIFRGGDGKPVYENGILIEQAVFTKDIAYYEGFEIAHKFITDQIKDGVSPKDLFTYLLKGKFDPTSERHQIYLREIGIKTL